METVFRVLGKDDWNTALAEGTVPPCGSDTRDGFIHLSGLEDVVKTANLYFEPHEVPLVLEVEAKALGEALRWEPVPSREGRAFPHLYAPGIPLAAIRATHALSHDGLGFSLGTRKAL